MPTGASLPVGYGTTVNTTSGPVLPANSSRNALIFVNASVGISIAICPAAVNVGAFGVYIGLAAGVASINGAGSVTMGPGDKFIVDTIACTAAFNGIASGAGGVLTVWES